MSLPLLCGRILSASDPESGDSKSLTAGGSVMPVRELIRGLLGALAAFLATLILLLCLAETRNSERGIWWHTGRSGSVYFSPIWHPLLAFGAMNMVVGYVLAGKLTTKRSVLFALVGAVLAVGLNELVLPIPLAHLSGQAGRNTVWLLNSFVAFAGACGGAWIAGDLGERKRRRKVKAEGIIDPRYEPREY